MIIKKFLLSCSGANHSVLERIDSPQEVDKYVAQGTAVLVTSSMATLSGGYALYVVFGTTLLAVPFGIFWGGSILLLDRLLLITMRKKRGNPWKQLTIAAPRLVLALFIGLTVSKPLELRVCQPEIQEAVHASEYNALKQDLAKLENDKKNAEAEIKEALTTANQLSASVLPDKKASAVEYRNQAAKKSREVTEIDKEIAQKKKLLKTRNHQKVNLGLLRQIVILEKLAEVQPTVRYTVWVLSTLFVLFEILPVLTKLMSKYSIYDAALENLETTGIKLQDKLQEVSLEQIDREALVVRQYREAMSVMVKDEILQASQQQIALVRQIDRSPGMTVRQTEIANAVTDRIHTEIKNAVGAPTDPHQPKANSVWDMSTFRRKLDNLFWRDAD